jgi:hypothetical protein
VTDVEGLTLEELEDEIAELASHTYAGSCRWLELVGELDRRGGFAESGYGSCAEWLAWRCGLMPRAAREHVRVARRLAELPLIREAFICGELSYAKVRALTRVAAPATEQELLELARELTAAQLDRVVRAYRYVSAKEANELQDLVYVGWSWDDDGLLRFSGCLAPEDGAMLLRALEAGRDAVWQRHFDAGRLEAMGDMGDGPAEPLVLPRRPSTAEAFVAMAERSLACSEDRPSAERYQVVLHVDAGALAGEGEGAGGCHLDDGPALARDTARRLACDASVVLVSEIDGEPLSVGRRTRTIPPALRRALRTRDRGCRFPGCDRRRFVDAHHVRHWACGGETSVDNLVLLCRRHHRLVHEGGFSAECLADGAIRFRYPWGQPIPDVPRSPPGDVNRLRRQPLLAA